MGTIEKFATTRIAPRQRLRYWNDLVDRIYTGTWVNTQGEEFRGEMWRWDIGDLAMIRPRSTQSTVGRRGAAAGGEERVILHLQCRGSSRHTQNGDECVLQPGDFVLSSPHQPYTIDLREHELLVVEFPRAPLAERIPKLDDMLRRHMTGGTPGGRVFHDFLLSLWQLGDQSELDPEWESGVTTVFYDLFALAMRGAQHAPRGAHAGDHALSERMVSLVEASLGDPALGSAMLATSCNTSIRTIQNVFAAMGTTPTAYILERRLRRAADRLIVAPDTSITDIAFDLGFNDSAYFTRCFRRHFGAAPRDWRAAR
ncbi:helix-turn-helix domain-containing protein [Sphingomonas sp. MMSM20]|uniref:helix-turn-helix domain-containing protein n=1 Tax=Sphingomonas lycopersici TaxID=2951807 RepID=UPI00223912D3|nr:helix-turn-helix domain-containing protein [Sphingomonas lycopersici]